MVLRRILSILEFFYGLVTGITDVLIDVVNVTFGQLFYYIVYWPVSRALMMLHALSEQVILVTPYPGHTTDDSPGEYIFSKPPADEGSAFYALMTVTEVYMETLAMILVVIGIALVLFMSIFDVYLNIGWDTGEARKRLLIAPLLILLWIPLANLALFLGYGLTSFFSDLTFHGIDELDTVDQDAELDFNGYIADLGGSIAFSEGVSPDESPLIPLVWATIAAFGSLLVYIIAVMLAFLRIFLLYTLYVVGPIAISFWAFGWKDLSDLGGKYIRWFIMLAVMFPAGAALFMTMLPVVFAILELIIEGPAAGGSTGMVEALDLPQMMRGMFILVAPVILGFLPWGFVIGMNKAMAAGAGVAAVGGAVATGGAGLAAMGGMKQMGGNMGKISSAASSAASRAGGAVPDSVRDTMVDAAGTAKGRVVSNSLMQRGSNMTRKVGRAPRAGAGYLKERSPNRAVKYGGRMRSRARKSADDLGGFAKSKVEDIDRKDLLKAEKKVAQSGVMSQYGGLAGQILEKGLDSHADAVSSERELLSDYRKQGAENRQKEAIDDEMLDDEESKLMDYEMEAAGDNIRLSEGTRTEIADAKGLRPEDVDGETAAREYMRLVDEEGANPQDVFDGKAIDEIREGFLDTDIDDVREVAFERDKMNNPFAQNRGDEEWDEKLDELYPGDNTITSQLYGHELGNDLDKFDTESAEQAQEDAINQVIDNLDIDGVELNSGQQKALAEEIVDSEVDGDTVSIDQDIPEMIEGVVGDDVDTESINVDLRNEELLNADEIEGWGELETMKNNGLPDGANQLRKDLKALETLQQDYAEEAHQSLMSEVENMLENTTLDESIQESISEEIQTNLDRGEDVEDILNNENLLKGVEIDGGDVSLSELGINTTDIKFDEDSTSFDIEIDGVDADVETDVESQIENQLESSIDGSLGDLAFEMDVDSEIDMEDLTAEDLFSEADVSLDETLNSEDLLEGVTIDASAGDGISLSDIGVELDESIDDFKQDIGGEVNSLVEELIGGGVDEIHSAFKSEIEAAVDEDTVLTSGEIEKELEGFLDEEQEVIEKQKKELKDKLDQFAQQSAGMDAEIEIDELDSVFDNIVKSKQKEIESKLGDVSMTEDMADNLVDIYTDMSMDTLTKVERQVVENVGEEAGKEFNKLLSELNAGEDAMEAFEQNISQEHRREVLQATENNSEKGFI